MKEQQFNGEQLTISEGDEQTALYILQRIMDYNMQKVPLNGVLALEPLNVILKNSKVQSLQAISSRIW